MKVDTTARALALAVLAAGCTVVVPGQDGGTRIVPVVVRPDALPPPKPLEASVLFVVDLERSSANLSEKYASIMIGLAGYMQSVGIQIDSMGVIATYADQFGPRLLLGRNQMSQPGPSITLLAALASAADAGVTDYAALLPYLSGTLGNISDGDLPVALQLLASSGSFDGNGEASEARNVIEFGRGLNVASLPPQLGGIDRSALFDRPHDMFIVIYIQPLPRRCALGSSACLVGGRSPADIFTETAGDGSLTWLGFGNGSILPEQVVQVAVATSEGEDIGAFRTRCAAVAGFPRDLFDVIAPSANAYFTPLMAALNSKARGTGHVGDFCELIGSAPQDAIVALGKSVAAAAH